MLVNFLNTFDIAIDKDKLIFFCYFTIYRLAKSPSAPIYLCDTKVNSKTIRNFEGFKQKKELWVLCEDKTYQETQKKHYERKTNGKRANLSDFNILFLNRQQRIPKRAFQRNFKRMVLKSFPVMLTPFFLLVALISSTCLTSNQVHLVEYNFSWHSIINNVIQVLIYLLCNIASKK